MFGLYLHLPFCRKRCTYCNFYLTTERGNFEKYLSALQRRVDRSLPELLAARGGEGAAYTVALGGGTPSLAPPEWIAALLQTLSGTLGPAVEVSLEANPEDLDRERLGGLRTAGVTRLTIGVQTLDDALLAALGRVHDAARAEQAVRDAQAAGFSNLGIDLIFGLPGQTPESARADLTTASRWPVQHISHYALEVEGATVLGKAVLERKKSAWEDDLEAGFYDDAGALLGAAGFFRYEVSNYARPGFESLHNSLYWTDRDYLGLGPSAASYWRGNRWSEIADLRGWLQREESASDAATGLIAPPPAELWRDALAMGMRLSRGVDWNALWKKYRTGDPPLPESALAKLLDQRLLRWEAPRISVAADRQFLTEGIISEILAQPEISGRV